MLETLSYGLYLQGLKKLNEFYKDPTHNHWSIRKVAEYCGINEYQVRKRRELLQLPKLDKFCYCEVPVITGYICDTCGNKIKELYEEHRRIKEEEHKAQNRECSRVAREKKKAESPPKPPHIKMSEEEKRRKKSEYNRLYRESHKDPVKEQEILKVEEERLARKLEKQKPKPPKWGTKIYWEQHPEIKVKKCSKCDKIRPETEEYFYYLPKEDRFQNRCKTCRDNECNRDKKAREAKRLQGQEWLKSPDGIEYTEQQRIKRLAQKREHSQLPEVKEKRRKYKKAYKKTPKGHELKANERRAYRHTRRARENGLETSLTAKQWEECKSFFNGCCAYCGKEADITMDHFIAVANGGEYSRDNALPACHACNSSKRDIDFWEWYPQQPFYSKLREKKLLKYLNYKAEGVQQRTLFG